METVNKNIRIAVAGTGYVGLSIATLLSQHHQVTAVDVVPEKVDLINNRQSPIQDDYIEKYLAEKDLHLKATTNGEEAYKNADFIVIATPTNYDPVKNYFDTTHVEEVIELVMRVNPDAIMVIKSTIPVGYTENVRKKYHCDNIIFAPEFLRESKALYDNLYPSRIIVGRPEGDERLDQAAHTFASLLQEGAIKQDIDTLFMGLTEAEAVKLFANTYLALRVSFFNELDTYAEMKTLASVLSTTTRRLATEVTVCLRTPNSCWPTMPMFPRTLFKPLLRATAPVRTLSPTECSVWLDIISIRITAAMILGKNTLALSECIDSQ